MIVTIALKKKTSTKLIDKIIASLIKWKTKSEYFHVEMIIKNKWISTNPTANTVYIHDLLPLNDHYDYFNINIHGAKVNKMLKFAESQVGKKYDWKGIFLSQAVDFNIDNKNKWFCSEFVAEMLKIGGYNTNNKPSNQYSPEDIYQLVKTV